MAEPPFSVHIAGDAAERIRRRGGRLFLWQRPVGVGIRDYVSIGAPPSDLVFDCYHHAKRDLQICVATDLGPREIIVQARRWPFSGVRVYVDGKRWGWRGEAVTAPM